MRKERIIITIHGIRWNVKGDWQNEAGERIKAFDPDIKVFHYRYGFTLAVASWFSTINVWMMNRAVGKFYGFIKRIVKKCPDAEISILAHSYGGWIVNKMLEHDSSSPGECVTLKNILFMHCPIPAHIQSTNFWNWLDFGKIQRVYSWSSKKDMVIGRIAIKPFGQNGYWGFIRVDHPTDRGAPVEKPYAIEIYNYVDGEGHGGGFTNWTKYWSLIIEHLLGDSVVKRDEL